MNYKKMNRVAFEEKIRGDEYPTAVGASRAVGKALTLSKKDREHLKALITEHFKSKSASTNKTYRKIARRLTGKKRYVSLSYAQRAISRALDLTKAERSALLAEATQAFSPKPKAETTLSKADKTVRKELSKVFFKKRPFFEVFNEAMHNKQARALLTEFCTTALEAEGDGVSLPTIVAAIKRAKTG